MDDQRFGNDNDTESFIEKMKNKYTARKTEYDLNLIRKYFESLGEIRPPNEIQPQELDINLARFFLNIRKLDGSEYEPDTLKTFQSSLGRYLLEKKYGHNILTDVHFQHSRDVLSAKRKELKSKGKGNKPNQGEPLNADDIAILYEKGQLGTGSPEALVNTMWWNNTTHFGLRSRQEHIDMRWGDVELLKTSKGEEYLQYSERATKTRSGVTSDVRPFHPKMFAVPGDARCPVVAYKEYEKRRPADLNDDQQSSFYLSIKTKLDWGPDQIWFSRQNLGKNKIGNLLPSMCKKAGIQVRKVNHSARRTTVTTLLHQGIAPTTVMQVTGHKSVTSINHYGSASLQQQKDMSNAMSALNGTTSNSDLNNSDDDQQLLRASQEVENAIHDIENFENLMTNFDIEMPNPPCVVEIPTTTVSGVSSTVPTNSSTWDVAVTIPNNVPSVIDIPMPLNMSACSNTNTASTTSSNYWCKCTGGYDHKCLQHRSKKGIQTSKSYLFRF